MSIFNRIINQFPRGIVYSFGYGSGVKQQIGYDQIGAQKSNVIDLTFCVENALKWHSENLEKNPDHYSGIRILGGSFIASYQDKLAARAYFNTLVPLTDIGVTIKYGVVSRRHLLEDLQDWKYLYFAGRLHKPVHNVIPPVGSDLQEALLHNLQSAVVVALLMLPEKFCDFDLFYTISNLSYKGDFRMIFGENKNKVKNIVTAQLDDFFNLYSPVLQKLTDYVAVGTDKSKNLTFFEQDKSEQAINFYMNILPANLRRRIRKKSGVQGSYEEVVQSLANSGTLSDVISSSVDNIVWRSSISQSAKNIPTAGFAKSLIYSYRKALKSFN